MAAAYTLGEAASIAIRHNDWWGAVPRTSFHFIAGGSPSKNQDALLHGAIAYQTSRLSYEAFRWACVNNQTAAWLGAAVGLAIELPKEIGDGFHNGFSVPDMTAAVLGAALPAFHRVAPSSRIVTLKGFYWPSDEYRNRVPGALPQLENDYAGQRYYLSINPGRGGSESWPRWLGVAIGHGVDRWVTGPPQREVYLALDVDFAALLNSDGTLYKIARLLDQIHFPAPGVKLVDGDISFGLF